MTKRRILYSELTAPAPSVAPASALAVAAIQSAQNLQVEAPPRPMRERARVRSGRAELLVFRVGNERFGVELSAVEEVIDLPVIHHVPEMPPAFLGVISVRGLLTPAYSPHAVLGLPLASGEAALIFRRGRTRAGIVIDDVDDAATVDLGALRGAPGLDESGGVVLGVVRHADALLALVDADALIAACQAAPTLEPS